MPRGLTKLFCTLQSSLSGQSVFTKLKELLKDIFGLNSGCCFFVIIFLKGLN